jgi:hypothetical protein
MEGRLRSSASGSVSAARVDISFEMIHLKHETGAA